MEFTKKNDFIVKNKSLEHFERDLELFKSTCPNSRLHPDLKRLNSFNRSKIHGMVLFELLGKVSPEEILKNRQETIEEIQDQDETPIVDTVEEVKAIVAAEMDIEHLQEEVFTFLVGKTAEEIKVLVALSKGSFQSTKTTEYGEHTGTGSETTGDGSGTPGNDGSEIQGPNTDPENGSETNGVPSGETVSELQEEDKSGSSDTVSLSTESDADASGLEHKNQSGSVEGSGDESAEADPEKKEDPVITPEAVKPEKSEVAPKPVQPRKPGATRPANKKKGAKKKSSRR